MATSQLPPVHWEIWARWAGRRYGVALAAVLGLSRVEPVRTLAVSASAARPATAVGVDLFISSS